VDYLAIDAVFMPVKRVNYTVEAAIVGETSDKDRLTLEMWTNGSITPQEALSQAARILVDLLKPLQDITFETLVEQSKPTQDKISQIAIEELQLSVRAYNCLKRAQINYVADLLQFTEEDLLEIKNFGQKSAEEVIDALREKLGLTLPKERPVRA
jgi:DNA-directed RNA polymerase subunit alpha